MTSRAVRFCSEEKPRCPAPDGHRLRVRMRPTHDALIECDHRPHRGGAPCGAISWVALLHFGGSAVVRGKGERLWVVVEVTRQEADHITRVPMTLLEKLAYLKCTLPGVDLDLLGGA